MAESDKIVSLYNFFDRGGIEVVSLCDFFEDFSGRKLIAVHPFFSQFFDEIEVQLDGACLVRGEPLRSGVSKPGSSEEEIDRGG